MELAHRNHQSRIRKAAMPTAAKTTVLLLLLPFCGVHIASAVLTEGTVIEAVTANKGAVLGSAYDKQKEEFVGQSCVIGDSKFTGASTAEFHLDTSLSQREMSSMLGLDADGKAHYGAVEVSASAHFFQEASSSNFSVSAVWSSEYRLPPEILTNPVKSPIGITAAGDDLHWVQTCGDEFVDEIRRGARLLVSVRVDFASKRQKEEFESRFSLSGPIASVNAKLSEATAEFARDTRITITGTQFGGDVSKLTALFDNSPDGKEAFTKCSLGDFDKCAAVITNVLSYATDISTGFPSQLAPDATPGGAVLSYHSSPYKSAAIYQERTPLLDLILEQRRHLLVEFDKQLASQVLGNRLKEWGGLNEKQLTALNGALTIVDSNLKKIVAASKVCYGAHPSDCPDVVDGLVLPDVDPNAFEPPAPPEASYRLWTSEDQLLSRMESVAEMTACHQEGGARPCQRPRSLAEAGGQGTASVVLYIQGTALREAQLYFNDMKIGDPVDLHKASEKNGKEWAMVVIESNRQTPKWLDINLDAIRESLMGKPELAAADGTFYLLVKDAFGRQTRFDIEYARWAAGKVLRRAHRWWDRAAGVVTAGNGNWSYELIGEGGNWRRGSNRRSVAVLACGGGGGGGGSAGARHEKVDNAGGGGGGAGSPLVSVVLWDLSATMYTVALGSGGAGGSGGVGGGNNTNGSPGVPGTATTFGPSTDIRNGAVVDGRVQVWPGAPGGGGGVAPRGFPVIAGYIPDLDGKGGPGGSGPGFTSGGYGGGADSGGGPGASSGGVPGGSGGGVHHETDHDGGGGGGGGAGGEHGGAGGYGAAASASQGASGGNCAGGGGAGGYGQDNRPGLPGGSGGAGWMEIVALQSCPEYDINLLLEDGCRALSCDPDLAVVAHPRDAGSDRLFHEGASLVYCRAAGTPSRRDCMVIDKTEGGVTTCMVSRYFDCAFLPNDLPQQLAAYCDLQVHP